MNLYRLVGNNPISNVDPLGLEGNPISSTLPGLNGRWNSDASGGAGSFYGPGFYQSLAIQQADAEAAAQAAAIAAYNATVPSDFQLGADGYTHSGIETDDGTFALLAPFLAPESAGFSKCVHGNSLRSMRPTWGYKLYSGDGTFLKNGITSKVVPESRSAVPQAPLGILAKFNGCNGLRIFAFWEDFLFCCARAGLWYPSL